MGTVWLYPGEELEKRIYRGELGTCGRDAKCTYSTLRSDSAVSRDARRAVLCDVSHCLLITRVTLSSFPYDDNRNLLATFSAEYILDTGP